VSSSHQSGSTSRAANEPAMAMVPETILVGLRGAWDAIAEFAQAVQALALELAAPLR